jgi:Divergent InlB B-repeat domain
MPTPTPTPTPSPGRTLSVRKTPVAEILGSVVSSPPGISCGLLCVEASSSFADGTPVTLTAQAVEGWTFHWTGDCSGNGTCAVTMNADREVVLHFTVAATAAPPTEAAGSVALRSRLVLSGGRAEVSVGGRSVSVGAGTETEIATDVGPGDHLVEGWVREGAGEGLWRFALGTSADAGRRIRSVLAGDPVSLTPVAVVFRVRGRLPQKIAFVLSVAAPDADARSVR